MAHKGIPGPYLFRRDFNLNVQNNADGFYRRNYGIINGPFHGPAAAVVGHKFDCGPDFYPSIDTIGWDSLFEQFGIVFFQLQLRVAVLGSHYQRSVTLQAGFALAPIWRGQALQPEFDTAPGWSFAQRYATQTFDPAFFTTPPGIVDVLAFPKLWTDGAPH